VFFVFMSHNNAQKPQFRRGIMNKSQLVQIRIEQKPVSVEPGHIMVEKQHDDAGIQQPFGRKFNKAAPLKASLIHWH
jgi:hypothetical protein